jgi:hypothetical protein
VLEAEEAEAEAVTMVQVVMHKLVLVVDKLQH